MTTNLIDAAIREAEEQFRQDALHNFWFGGPPPRKQSKARTYTARPNVYRVEVKF